MNPVNFSDPVPSPTTGRQVVPDTPRETVSKGVKNPKERFGETVNVLTEKLKLNLDRKSGKTVFVSVTPASEQGLAKVSGGESGAKNRFGGNDLGLIFNKVG